MDGLEHSLNEESWVNFVSFSISWHSSFHTSSCSSFITFLHPSVLSIQPPSHTRCYSHSLFVLSPHLTIYLPRDKTRLTRTLNMKHHSWRRLASLAALCSLLQGLNAEVGSGPILSSQTISILGDELYLHGGNTRRSCLDSLGEHQALKMSIEH